jgi:transcriptional regulator with XRE-family HTH domain
MPYNYGYMRTTMARGEDNEDITLDRFFGDRLRSAREAAGWDQKKLGEEMGPYLGNQGWHWQTVSSIERGKRPLKVWELIALADLLGKPLDWFRIQEDPEARFVTRGGVQIPASRLAPPLSPQDTEMAAEACSLALRVIGRARTAIQEGRQAEGLAALNRAARGTDAVLAWLEGWPNRRRVAFALARSEDDMADLPFAIEGWRQRLAAWLLGEPAQGEGQ